MRSLKRGAAVAALAAFLLPTLRPGAAGAEELLVMPYSCSMSRGQPVLTPGSEQSHRIIGQREQRKHKACSPVNPDMCRSWTVHRFDLDCEGRRVSWVSVVAATNEGSRRAWLLDGRLLLRMGARWSLAPDDPCAQEGPDNRPAYGGRLRRQCAERLALAPPPVVEMPFGFAPMMGVDGIFVTAAPLPPDTAKVLPPIVTGPPPPQSASADTRAPSASADTKAPSASADTRAKSPSAADAKPSKSASADSKPPPEPLHEPKAGELKAKATLPTPPVPVPVIPPAPQPAPKVASATEAPPAPPSVENPATQKVEAEPKPPVPKLATPPASRKEPPSSSTSASPGSHGPRISTLSPPSPTVSEVPKRAAPSEATKPAGGDARPAPSLATVPTGAERPSPPVKPAPQTKPEAAPPEAGSSPGLLSWLRPTTTGAIVTLAGLALGLLTAFTLARRREHAQDAGRRRRDISALSLDGKHAKTAKASPRTASGATTGAPQGTLPKPPDLMGRLAMSDVADWSDRMPGTREEALEVLGIGIEPSANAAALKKIVDGLRMSWHPDLAKDEIDRALREHRSKQINAAWDIILQARRAEA